jgi:hypothetical protein
MNKISGIKLFMKISKHIALIDTLINIDYNEQTSATSTTARSKSGRNQVIRD